MIEITRVKEFQYVNNLKLFNNLKKIKKKISKVKIFKKVIKVNKDNFSTFFKEII